MKPLIWLLAMLICTPALAQRQSFPPVDEAANDPDLAAFRDSLRALVDARDVDGIVAAACPDIYLSHSTLGGPDELRENLTASSQLERDAFWAALQDTLSQPGYFDDQGEFWMPHPWQITLPAALDPFTAYFVTGENVSLRAGPSRDDTRLAAISHEVVIVPNYTPGAEYQQVVLTDGGNGFMHSDFLWSMVGYRAAFVKSASGEWQLCTFVTGD
ncbi:MULTISPECIES: SH3 domain-containing protein [unclassified Ruegeria]|uniref:SH3 domain-containing protein n=1 Tax=unclassified Ruegeria TaxID=2625375 RepID=UPI001487FAD5|nr:MULTISPECIES: SH3 domain-containing protein [unclassified Ruegeria]